MDTSSFAPNLKNQLKILGLGVEPIYGEWNH